MHDDLIVRSTIISLVKQAAHLTIKAYRDKYAGQYDFKILAEVDYRDEYCAFVGDRDYVVYGLDYSRDGEFVEDLAWCSVGSTTVNYEDMLISIRFADVPPRVKHLDMVQLHVDMLDFNTKRMIVYPTEYGIILKVSRTSPVATFGNRYSGECLEEAELKKILVNKFALGLYYHLSDLIYYHEEAN